MENLSIVELKEKLAITNKLIKAQEKLASIKGSSEKKLSPKAKAILWRTKQGWKIGDSFKEVRTWTNKQGITQTKEFDGLTFEKDGEVIKPLWVNGGNVLRVWN
jgi:hypothetical protein